MDWFDQHTLLTPAQMNAVDRAAVESGLDSYGLMDMAGRAVAAAVLRLYPGALRIAVFCGPGNNGGDGYVAARELAVSGAPVAIFHLKDPASLKGDARKAYEACGLPSDPLADYQPDAGDVVIDAIFGAGLDRPVADDVVAVIQRVGAAKIPVVAVDLPSGVNGQTGAVMGAAFEAAHTVTFMARKPGHLLMPGRRLCSTVEVADIGIPRRILLAHADRLAENAPRHWQDRLPVPGAMDHKFSRGHLVVFSGGGAATGAARLSAEAALKVAAGLVTVAAPHDALAANAAQLTAVMLKRVDEVEELKAWVTDKRLSAFVLGPGFGIGQKARDFALCLSRHRLVLDADGITSFKDDPNTLFSAFAGGEPRLVLTPHDGEFARLFPDLAADSTVGKVERARLAAVRSNASVVCKGADTVIAAPDGRALINSNAPPWLATAGSGDVLAGIIGGLMAAGVPAFEAAAAGVWLHGAAAHRAGQGMTAEDLAKAVRPL